MKDKLPPPVTLTAKQARFVECIARGMLSKDAYRAAYDSDVDDISRHLRRHIRALPSGSNRFRDFANLP